MYASVSQFAVMMLSAAGAVMEPTSAPPLSFESPTKAKATEQGQLDSSARGFVIDERYRVPSSTSAAADITAEVDAIGIIARTLDLKWSLNRDVYSVPADMSPLTAKPVVLRNEPLPIAILPSPVNVVTSLAGVPPSADSGLFMQPGTIRPKIAGAISGITIFVPRKGDGLVSDSLTPRMQGVAASAVPTTPFVGDRYLTLGRVVSRYGVMGADKLDIYDDIIAQASTAMITRSIWYYQLELANPHKGKRRGGRLGVLDDASILGDWCFPIMDGNGQARPADDNRRAERASPYENLVTTRLVEFPITGQQVPIIVPTAWDTSGDTMSAGYKAKLNAYEGTETIVLPQRLIDAAGGVVIVRKSASWRPLAEDIVIDSDTKNHAGILGVYISQVVTDDLLIDALAELCGKIPPTGKARDALRDSVSKGRDRE